jgi:choloylglycine hydrolase
MSPCTTASRACRALLVSGLLTAIALPPADACTSLALVAEDGTLVYGRTMEWGAFDLHSRVVVTPQATAFSGTTPDGLPGLQWKGRYGFVGLDMVGQDFIGDGMNEKGLVVGVLYFPGFAQFQSYDPGQASTSLSSMQLAAWMLSQFATVEEVRQELSTIRVVAIPLPELNDTPAPMHFSVMDASGKAIVIEYTKDGLSIFDNPLRVMTNAPTFDWHMTNLRNYVGLSAFGKPARNIAGIDFQPIGSGSGLIGLPGDFTPPSRFVRAVAFTQTARKTSDGPETVYEVLRVLDTFNVPLPAAGSPDIDPLQQADMRSSTIWSSIADTRNLVYYYHTQNNRTVRKVDLKRIDFTSTSAGIRRFPMDSVRSQSYEDVTPN